MKLCRPNRFSARGDHLQNAGLRVQPAEQHQRLESTGNLKRKGPNGLFLAGPHVDVPTERLHLRQRQ